MRTSQWLSLLLLVAAASPGLAQKGNEPKPPAPAADKNLPGPFQPYNITGKEKHRGKFHCLVSENGLNPVAMVLIRGAETPPAVADLLKELDGLVDKNQRTRLASFAVFVTDPLDDLVGKDDERDKEVARVEQYGNGLKNVPIALDTLSALKKAGYELDDKTAVTVILYNRLKVVDTLKFSANDLNADKVKEVRDRVLALLKATATSPRNAEPAP